MPVVGLTLCVEPSVKFLPRGHQENSAFPQRMIDLVLFGTRTVENPSQQKGCDDTGSQGGSQS